MSPKTNSKRGSYSFDVDHATDYGVEAAIVIHHIKFWILKNRADGRNLHEGKIWTFTSIRALSEIFPFWTVKMIRRILETLRKQSVLQVGNFNKKRTDRTLWYAFVDQERFIGPAPICPNGQIDLPEMENASTSNGQMQLSPEANGFAQTGKRAGAVGLNAALKERNRYIQTLERLKERLQNSESATARPLTSQG